ncbi:hypothetical protein SEA_MUFASA8_30 [Arthrobacter phage Mufasa8]|uniref:Uncharacterized protein n=1 Tax=Arthrobacter phage Mufasa8 TaxID=2656526 RepID=A0A649VN71_9CAUD|nr:hypothetical protein HYQ08_gp030 [Arthrobacter phage Mufasa8]QGJ93479.1 hypothetical protein SEA_MUFASA8_30 [Arthrobacter phage Mufasa8]
MKITEEEAVRLLNATADAPGRVMDMGYLNGTLLDTPQNAWAVALVNEWRAADPVARVAEYLRQRKRLDKTQGDVIHGVHSDPEAEMVQLTIEDLEAVLTIAQKKGA